MRQLIRRILPYLARCHPKNWDRRHWGYPQLWYCMPNRYYTAGEYWWRKQYCTFCGGRIKGNAAWAANDPSWPAPVQWCGVCPKPASFHPSETVFSTVFSEKVPRPVLPLRKRIVGYWLRPLVQWACGLVSGHEPSRTEWGYGGGKFVDRNCRWCDHRIKVPIQEDPPPNDLLEDLASKL